MDQREVKQICSESACPLVALCIQTERSIVAGNRALLLARLIEETWLIKVALILAKNHALLASLIVETTALILAKKIVHFLLGRIVATTY
jgi:hypothetical protein